MFPWSRPKPPLDPPEKLWVEQGLTWLVRTFGVERLKKPPVILPTPDFFPDPYDPVRGSDDDARALLRRVCLRRRRSRPRRPSGLPGAPDAEKPEGREVIFVVRESLTRPEYFVSRMARGLAKVRLIDDGKMAPDHPDLPRMADLAAVYLGLGVFVANHIFQRGVFPGWDLRRPGPCTGRET